MVDSRYDEHPQEYLLREASQDEVARAQAYAAREATRQTVAVHEMRSTDTLARAHAHAVNMGGAQATANATQRGPSANSAPYRDITF